MSDHDSKVVRFPLSEGQKAMWLQQQVSGHDGMYNNHFVWKLPESIDIAVLTQCLKALTVRHQALHGVYQFRDNQPEVELCDPLGLFDKVIFEQHMDAETDEEIKSFFDEELARPFDLSNEPVVRWGLFTNPSNNQYLGLFMQHTNIDLWSCMVAMDEIRQLYGVVTSNPSISLDALAESIGEAPKLSDYVQWQRDYLAQDAAEDERFWMDQLQGMEPTISLATDYPRSDVQSCQGDYFQFDIPQHLIDGMSELATRYNTSLYALYFSVFHLLIHRLSGQSDLGIGTPVGGRVPEFNGAFGYISNSFVLRHHHDSNHTFESYLNRFQNTVTEALKHQFYPLPLLAEQLNLDRDASRASFFQVSFVWENINRFIRTEHPQVSLDKDHNQYWDMLEGGTWNRLTRKQQLDDFDIVFRLNKFKDTIYGGIDFNTDLYEPKSIERLSQSFVRLLESIYQDATSELAPASISQLSILPQQEYLRLSDTWSAEITPSPLARNFLDTLTQTVMAFSDDIAVSYKHHNETYAGLEARSNQLANYLIEQGVKRNDIVGICIERSIDMVVSVLAVMKAGAAYVPLDPDYPEDRLKWMLEDSETNIIVATGLSLVSLPETSARLISLAEHKYDISNFSTDRPQLAIADHDLAYVIYTSGSTGKPKGVELTHGNLTNLIETQRAVFQTDRQSRVLLFSSLNFDASIFSIVLSLQSGGRLYVAGKEDLLGDALSTYLKNNQINWALIPPSVLSSIKNDDLGHLTELVVGGEECSDKLLAEWSANRRFYNAYGPTESTVWATCALLNSNDKVTLGQQVLNTEIYILDQNNQPLPDGVAGELCIAGAGLAKGYLNRPDLTSDKFVEVTLFGRTKRLYKTGDLSKKLTDGSFEFLGRIDDQVKIRGLRIELGEIEAVLLQQPEVEDALVMARDDLGDEKVLVAYLQAPSVDASEIKQALREALPAYMVPNHFVFIDTFPLTPNQKIDRKALPKPDLLESYKSEGGVLPRNQIETAIAEVWSEVLGIEGISITENFFDLGGHSLSIAKVYSLLPELFKARVDMVDLFKYPTIQSLAHYIDQDIEEDELYVEADDHIERLRLRRRLLQEVVGFNIAVVGMSGRFPGAQSVEQLWSNIVAKKESISFFGYDELAQAGVSKELLDDPDYVRAKGALDDIKGFDAEFFGFSPREAQITDPQQRIFLECCWESLEDAGVAPSRFDGRIGVYAGMGMNNYLFRNLSSNPELLSSVGDYPVMIGNDKDFLATRVSYKLNLNGPAMVLQTACSTSLVAIHTACQALLNEECDVALAGGVSLGKLEKSGYLYQPGMIMSPDGHCRAFDHKAQGTVQGQGAGVVVLKRLDDALADNDRIYAVVRGTAINNDGSGKAGYTAPAVEGQAKVIMSALAAADLDPSEVGYIEAHGTGTPLGDPIEIEGLKAGYKVRGNENYQCAIGSVKTNLGHLDAAAGVTGFIKAVLSLYKNTLPPTLHFEEQNPKIKFEQTPFYVPTQAQDWPDKQGPKYAAVSSFGIGGTNAHAILQQSPVPNVSEKARPWRLITLSAPTLSALDSMTDNLATHLKENPKINFSDVCYTLHTGRNLFKYRRYLISRNMQDAILGLENRSPLETVTESVDEKPRSVVMLFPGQGSQYVNMGEKLYRIELTFRETVDQCLKILRERFTYIYEDLEDQDLYGQTDKLHQTFMTQPGLFIIEYALAKMLLSWGVKPDVMIGHSIGEYAAACIAGVFPLEHALELVAIRGQMIQELPSGKMLTVALSEEEVKPYLSDTVSLAAINGVRRCVLSGDESSIKAVHHELVKQEIQSRILHTSHAFHSHMMEPICNRFKRAVQRRSPQPPKMRFISSRTGRPITDQQATDPQYWADHLRYEVRFDQALDSLYSRREDQDYVFIEVGPGKVLSTLARQHSKRRKQDIFIETMRQPTEDISDNRKLTECMAVLWSKGISVDWNAYHSNRQRYKVSLPTYPFERKPYWVDPGYQYTSQSTMADTVLPDQQTLSQTESLDAKSKGFANLLANEEVTASQIALRALWQKTLGIDEIELDDNFFDLGGDSLIAVNLIAQMSKHFGQPVPSSSLLQYPSLRTMAEYIDKQVVKPVASGADNSERSEDLEHTSQAGQSLVVIQQGKKGVAPLFMVHPIGGEVYFYRELAHSLGADRPVIGFQATTLANDREPLESLEALATSYIDQLLAAGYQSPFLLGGSSFGGLVAYEMAQQLRTDGHEVRQLVMVDTPSPKDMPDHVNTSGAILEYLLADKVPMDLDLLNELSEADQIDYVTEQAAKHNCHHAIPPHLGLGLFKTWIAHQHMAFNYQPKAYPEDVVFYKHTERMKHFPANIENFWEGMVEGMFRVHQVPGNHITMNYAPNVQSLAMDLKPVLRHALPASDVLSKDVKWGRRATDKLVV